MFCPVMQISPHLLHVCVNVHMNLGREVSSDNGNSYLSHHLSLYCS